MINSNELMDRFGDVDFLHELWTKTRRELPRRIAELQTLARGEEAVSPEELSKRLHKLRGLISNFLTEQRAVDLLILCEKSVDENQLESLPKLWNDFERVVGEEVSRLDTWLAERGYPNVGFPKLS